MYFVSDFKKICKSRIVIALYFGMMTVCLLSPFFAYIQERQYPGFFENVGRNPFQFWLLMDSTNCGFFVYHSLYWIFPVLVTGFVPLNELVSSMREFLVIRKGKGAYYCSKIASTAVFSFIFFFSLLFLNLLVTYIIYPLDAPIIQEYIIPRETTFAYKLYIIDPLLMAFFYTVVNAVSIVIFALFVLGIWMAFRFRNKYLAIAMPVILMYGVSYIFDCIPALLQYNMHIILQPLANNGIITPITAWSYLTTFSMWLCVDVLLLVIGWFRNRNILR